MLMIYEKISFTMVANYLFNVFFLFVLKGLLFFCFVLSQLHIMPSQNIQTWFNGSIVRCFGVGESGKNVTGRLTPRFYIIV